MAPQWILLYKTLGNIHTVLPPHEGIIFRCLFTHTKKPLYSLIALSTLPSSSLLTQVKPPNPPSPTTSPNLHPPTMDTLPFELLLGILDNLPPSHSKDARLTSRRFNAALAKPTFGVLASFVDPFVALSTLRQRAANWQRRPRVIWSPNCSVPDGLPIPESFLLAMYAALGGTSWPCSSLGSAAYDGGQSRRSSDSSLASMYSDASSSQESDDEWGSGGTDLERLTATNIGKFLGRKDLTEGTLRQALFRYAIFLSYGYSGQGEAPQLWVMSSKQWNDRR